MKKQGFTLIELMVVIVIMGILSTVAIPKYFATIAKAKASELGPAAKTYVKLQDAYFIQNHQIGSWTLIGYSGPGSIVATDSTRSTNFSYGGGALKGSGASTALNGSSSAATVGWIATSLIALNDIVAGSSWTIAVGENNTGAVKYTVSIPANAEKFSPVFLQLNR